MRRPPIECEPSDNGCDTTKESRFAKVKRIISGTLLLGGGRSSQDSVRRKGSKMARKRDRSQDEEEYDEDRDKCNMKVENEVKESRLFIERKLIRSNSEERPINIVNKDLNAIKADNIRRVSSHEDFKKKHNNNGVVKNAENKPLHEININSSEKFATLVSDDNTPVTRNYSPNKINISPNRDPKAHFFDSVDSDTAAAEKRRQCERFSRPRGRVKLSSTPPTSSKAKKRKTSKYIHQHQDSKTDDKSDEEKVETIPLDLKSLHQQIDSAEPIPIPYSSYSAMYNKYNINEEEEPNVTKDDSIPPTISPLISSPRNSLILTRKVYLEPLISTKTQIPAAPVVKPLRNPIESRIKHISKQINVIKKKLKKSEEGLLEEGRYSDKKIRTLHIELGKLKKELKSLKTGFERYQESGFAVISIDSQDGDSNGEGNGENTDDIDDVKKRVEVVSETMDEIHRRLGEKRQYANRPEEINEMTEEHLIDEKTAVQKALLHLESLHGRPVTKEDRDIVRPLYDRYRILKRCVIRTVTAKLNNSVELGTIPEHETMHFVSSASTITTITTTQENDIKSTSSSSESTVSSIATISGQSADDSNGSDTDTASVNENLHALTYDELLDHLKIAREEKKQIRRTLKEYEHDFEQRVGRKLQKDDRINSTTTPSIEYTYFMYKQVKGKIKLIEVLMEKKRPIR